jgi:mannose-6-phosphate isomerase-like protein (cupin superfamily)
MTAEAVPEARLEETDAGLVPASRGWFVMNAHDARWFEKPGQGHSLPLTGDDAHEAETFFPMLGMAIRVVNAGEPTTTYHWETEQEDFLVLAGEGLLIVEGEERPLRQWDFVHCPPGTRHAFVGAGDARAPVRRLAAVPEGRPVGRLLRGRDGRPPQREPAGGHAGRLRRLRTVPRAADRALPRRAAPARALTTAADRGRRSP